MSTTDCPGFNPANNDELTLGCWAEHDDGSMIFVESVEDGRVVYSVFDFAGGDVVEYRDSMSEGGFKKAFSWNPEDVDDIGVWVWHDKTPFPWDKVIAAGARDGARPATADALLTAAQKVARSRSMRTPPPRAFLPSALSQGAARRIIDKVQRAIGELRR